MEHLGIELTELIFSQWINSATLQSDLNCVDAAHLNLPSCRVVFYFSWIFLQVYNMWFSEYGFVRVPHWILDYVPSGK